MKLYPILVLLVIVGIAGGAGYWYFSNNPDEWQQVLVDFGLDQVDALQTEQAKEDILLTASGFIEANEIPITSEVQGRIERMAVDQGDVVEAEQPLLHLETSMLGAQKAQIEAQIALAEAQLAQVETGTAENAIAVAEAAIVLAETQRDAAEQALQDAILLRDTPQQLDAQIDAARSEVQIAKLQMEQAEYVRDAADLGEDIAKDVRNLQAKYAIGDVSQASVAWNLASMEVWQGYINWESAQAGDNSTKNKLNTLLALKQKPLQAQLLITQAEAELQAKEAAVDLAEAGLQQLRAPVPQAQVDVLLANRDQARAQLDTLLAQLKTFTLTSPLDGVVVKKTAHVGEIAVPGIALLTVADLDDVSLTVYVSGADYGRIQPGQTVEVAVDSYPNEMFEGAIIRISDQAEFTPKNVQTQEERVSLVYAVKINIPNQSHKLKPGIPADVVFVQATSR
ncbi:MAG: HlyD family efflux transporter periplasmic adaptor subunit [Chloroflexi bacterium]|nr:HlyD family efflux transporter periplasmic adaptor subunit [Chloroflexota bacterium]